MNLSDYSKIRKDVYIYVILLLVLIFTAFVRIRMLSTPFERDEGEYAYTGQLILHGIPPYSLAYNMKLPGIYVAYAAMLAIFGQTIQGIHIGLLFMTLITIFLFYLICRKLFNPAIAAISSAIYAILGLGENIYGFSANAEPFVMVLAIPAILLLIYAFEKQKLWLIFASAFLFGTSFLMKQHAAAFIVFSGLWLLIETVKQRPFSIKRICLSCSIFSVGVFVPYIITCLLMWKLGVFKNFWFWTFDYARQYVSIVPLKDAAGVFIYVTQEISKPVWPILILALIGLIAVVSIKDIRRKLFFVIGFFIFSFLSVCPGFFFRSHYFIFMLPSVALLAALGIYSIYVLISKTKIRFLPQIVLCLLSIFTIVYPVVAQLNYMFKMTGNQIVHGCYSGNPFVESIEIAKYIKENTQKDDLIAVLGSEPQIYFYSNRKSATGYIYTYPLMEKQDYAKVMQQQMIDEIEKNKPKYIVLVRIHLSWLANPKIGEKILKWSLDYTLKNYNVEGIIDIVSDNQTNYIWGDRAKTYKPLSESFILICKRKEV